MIFAERKHFLLGRGCLILVIGFLAVVHVGAAGSRAVFLFKESGTTEGGNVIETREGTAALKWKGVQPEGDDYGIGVCVFELQEAAGPEFSAARTRYRGTDRATVVTGLREREYYFRVRITGEGEAEASDWSKPLIVDVRYENPRLVLVLVITGMIVFVLTVGAIVQGHLHRSKEGGGEGGAS